jgi:hypothetical protein
MASIFETLGDSISYSSRMGRKPLPRRIRRILIESLTGECHFYECDDRGRPVSAFPRAARRNLVAGRRDPELYPEFVFCTAGWQEEADDEKEQELPVDASAIWNDRTRCGIADAVMAEGGPLGIQIASHDGLCLGSGGGD